MPEENTEEKLLRNFKLIVLYSLSGMWQEDIMMSSCAPKFTMTPQHSAFAFKGTNDSMEQFGAIGCPPISSSDGARENF